MKEFSTFADGYDCKECEALDKENIKLVKQLFFYSKRMLRYRDALKALVEDIETPSFLGLASLNPNWMHLNLCKELLKEEYEWRDR